MVACAACGPDRNAAAAARRVAGGAARRPLCRAPGQGVPRPAETADSVPRHGDATVATLTA